MAGFNALSWNTEE